MLVLLRIVFVRLGLWLVIYGIVLYRWVVKVIFVWKLVFVFFNVVLEWLVEIIILVFVSLLMIFVGIIFGVRVILVMMLVFLYRKLISVVLGLCIKFGLWVFFFIRFSYGFFRCRFNVWFGCFVRYLCIMCMFCFISLLLVVISVGR